MAKRERSDSLNKEILEEESRKTKNAFSFLKNTKNSNFKMYDKTV